MSRSARALLLVAVAFSAACGRPLPPTLPEGEEYVFPMAAPGELSPEQSRKLQKAWLAVLAGDGAAGEREARKLLDDNAGLIPARLLLAYARLRAGRLLEAQAGFDGVLAQRPADLSALVGAASVAFRRRQPEVALDLYRRAQRAHADDPVSRRRLAEVKLVVTEKSVTAARAALDAGEPDRAIEEYRKALEAAPEVSGLRLELANLLAVQGFTLQAADVLEADERGDRQVLLRLGELLLERKDYGRALAAYRRILARDPADAEAVRHAAEAREALELLEKPEEYRQIYTAARLTRADLAALIAVKVTALSRLPPREPEVAIDISGSWARDHVLKVLALGILDVYPNHTFQPGATIRRGDLGRAVGRILELLKWPMSVAPVLTDIAPSNLIHDGATRVVAAGLMDPTPKGAFEPWRPVTGRDAVDVLDALNRLVGP